MNICYKLFKNIISLLLLLLFISNIIFIPVIGNDAKQYYKIETRSDILPYPLSRGSAVWVEDMASIYIFGGRNETAILDRIMKYTPAEDKLTMLDTTLPTALMGTTAVYNGKFVYIFGGRDYDRFYDSILRFDPENESIIQMTAHLPKPTVGAAATWTGNYIYFFGGCWGGIEPQKFNTILRFDPERDNITLMNSTLTFGRSGLAATWDGENIYIIGGSDGKQFSTEIFRYSPNNNTLILLPGALPSGRLHIQAICHKDEIYIFGGRGGPTLVYDQIVKYYLKTDEVETLEKKLTVPSEFRMHAYNGENIYIIGGFNAAIDINQFITFAPATPSSSDENTSPSCALTDMNIVFALALVIVVLFSVVIIIIIIMVNKYQKRNK